MIFVKARDAHDLRRQLRSMFPIAYSIIDKTKIDMEKLAKAEPGYGDVILLRESPKGHGNHLEFQENVDDLTIRIPTRLKDRNVFLLYTDETYPKE